MVLFQKWNKVCLKNVSLVSGYFINEKSTNRRCLVAEKQVVLSVVRMAVFLFVFIPEWRPVYFQKMMLDPASFKISPTFFVVVLLQINRASLLLQPSSKQPLGFSPREGREAWLDR